MVCGRVKNMKRDQRKKIGGGVLALGSLVVAVPILYEIGRYASDDFYVWVIRHPGFMSNLGSGPYLLGMHIFSLLIAAPLIAIGSVLLFSSDE